MRSAEFLFVIVSLVLLLGVLPANAVDIFLSDDEITVNGFPISEEENLVWLQRKVYTRPDLPDEMIAEPVDAVTITDKGIYHITGTLSNGQILVDAGNRDKIELILDGVNITCRTAPAIMIVKAKEADNPRDAAVRITLGEGSENFLYGSHLEKEIENPSSKHFSGTISSKRSLLISGNGHLVIEAEGEGIECKKHLTIESGNIEIRSGDDGINLDEEEISQFTMNGGSLSILCDRDIMGDAIDSNGMIEINGGSVFLSSTPNFYGTRAGFVFRRSYSQRYRYFRGKLAG